MQNSAQSCWHQIKRGVGRASVAASVAFGALCSLPSAWAQDAREIQEVESGLLDRLKDGARDKIIYFQIHTELQKFEMYQKYYRHFDAQYATFVQDIVDSGAYKDTNAVAQKAQAFTTSIRKENAYLVYRAGNDANRKILQGRLDTLLLLKEREGEAVCGAYGALGPLGIEFSVLEKYLPNLSAESDATLEAIIAGKASDDTAIGSMTDADLKDFIQFMAASGMSEDQIGLLASTTGAQDGYCGAVVGYFRALLRFEGPIAQRVRASTNFVSASN